VADARAARLKVVPLFAHCDNRQLDFIATQVEEMDFPAGRVLCTEGMYGGDFFILESGTADVTRGGKKIATMQSGDFFGEIALVDGGRRTATVTTTVPSRAFVLEVIHSVMRALATRVREAGAAKAD